MSTPSTPLLTQAEYLERERAAEIKHEFFVGRMYPLHRELARIRGSKRHDVIRDNLRRELIDQISAEIGCVRSTAASVQCPTGPDFRPDVSICCGALDHQVLDQKVLILMEVLKSDDLMEVLKSDDDAYARSETFRHYRSIPLLREYWLIESEYPTIERFSRKSAREPWVLSEYHSSAATISIPLLNCSVNMASVYHDIDFDFPVGPRKP